jgi:4-hydroxy-tetrahydrodipicolinate reductase
MKIVIAGAGGRMGRALIEAALADRALTLAGAVDVPGSAVIGSRFGRVKAGASLAAALARGDALIDFTRPEGTLEHLVTCVQMKKAAVIGTTGFSAAQAKKIAEAARKIPVVMAPNFAIGVNVAYRLAEMAAQALGDAYDVEIIEAHHRMKADAPSGTAIKLGEVIAAVFKKNAFVFGRKGDTGERPEKQIGFHSIRGGDIVGEHTVLFAGAGERVEITVRSQSRMTYALGALRAAKWLRGRRAGLYDMADVLGLR